MFFIWVNQILTTEEITACLFGLQYGCLTFVNSNNRPALVILISQPPLQLRHPVINLDTAVPWRWMGWERMTGGGSDEGLAHLDHRTTGPQEHRTTGPAAALEKVVDGRIPTDHWRLCIRRMPARSEDFIWVEMWLTAIVSATVSSTCDHLRFFAILQMLNDCVKSDWARHLDSVDWPLNFDQQAIWPDYWNLHSAQSEEFVVILHI